MLRRNIPAILLLAAVAAAIAAPVGPARAEELVWTTGRVYSRDGLTPVAGAIVAVFNEKNKVVDYTRTDAEGRYTLAVPRSEFHLGAKGGGFFHQVGAMVGGVGKIITYPLRAGIRVADDAASAADPVTRIGVGAASGIASALVDNMSPKPHKRVPLERDAPGVLIMKVTEPGHNDAVSLARVYWMEEEVFQDSGKERRGLAAWVDPATLTIPGDEKPSSIASKYLTFTETRFEPSIAEPGQTVRLVARFPSPPDPHTPVIVVARNARTGRLYQLDDQGNGLYRAEIAVDRKFPKDDQMFVVLAYAEQDDPPGRNKKVEDALNGAGLFNPEKPYVYNPLLVVSRTRAEVTLTVVQPSRRRR